MAWSKTCPICRSFKIYRRTSWTCGGPPCVSAWKQLTGEQKSAYMEAAEAASALPQMTPQELNDWVNANKTTQSPIEKLTPPKAQLPKDSPLWDMLNPIKIKEEK